jgi:CHAT domain-containing protein
LLTAGALGRRRVLARAVGADQAPLERALAEARERLARLVVRGPDTLPAAQYSALVAQAREAGERAEEALAAVSARQRDERRERRVGFAEVRDALPPQSMLLSYVRYTHRAAAIAGERYGVFVTARDQEPRFIALGAANAVDAAISAVRAQILREASTPGRSARLNEAAYRRAAATLRQLVWDPVSAHIAGASKVFIVTDGSLGLVNFDALPLGDARYVIDGPATRHYLTAERDLARTATASASRTLLTLGDPDFDGRDTPPVTKAPAARRGAATPCSDFASLRFDRLPASAAETAAIASMWKPAAAIQLLGANASKASLKQHAPGARIVHLATHGFFLGDGCAGDNPLLLSGLAFAGANGRASAPADGDDGMLTSEEIATMDLSGVEWAVLSACDTGLGSIVAGEGVLGLQRAFQLAGTATVIMSLWPIDDRSTERWMTALYDERLIRQQPTADAVRAADRRMLAERRRDGRSTHPFYWAAFVATGDWR